MCHHHRHIFAAADLLFIREGVDPVLIQSKHALRARVTPRRRLTSQQKTSQVKHLQNASEGIVPLERPYGCTFASTARVTPYLPHGGGHHGLDYLRRTRSGASAAVTTCWRGCWSSQAMLAVGALTGIAVAAATRAIAHAINTEIANQWPNITTSTDTRSRAHPLTSSLDSSQPMKCSTIRDGSDSERLAVACHLNNM
jgi:hypothetical protein